MARLTIWNATTTLDGYMVTKNISGPTGARIFEGTLSGNGNTMEGSITQSIRSRKP